MFYKKYTIKHNIKCIIYKYAWIMFWKCFIKLQKYVIKKLS